MTLPAFHDLEPSEERPRRGGRWLPWTLVGWGVFSASLAGPGAEAAPASLAEGEARQRMDAVDSAIATMKSDLADVADGYRAPLRREGGRLQRRLREAEVQALLGDHFRAAIVLFDVAERPELRSDPQYDEAIFLLAESLRKAGQPRAARRYYEELASRVGGERLGQVVVGLLEVASDTGDFSGVERYVEALRAQAATTETSRIDYTFGKALFRGAGDDTARLSQALARLRAVPPGTSVSAPAAYYAGVTLVRMGRFEEALASFRRTLELAESHPETQRVRELASLSLGRLHHELGQTSQALDAYQGVSQDSPYFAEMLYEVAWVHVKAAEESEDPEKERRAHRRALEALELLTAAEPDARVFPKAKVLQGNLQIRLGAPESAYETFEELVGRYGSARSDLESLLSSRPSAREFFDELVATDLESLGETSLLPPMVVRYALDDPEIERAVDVQRDLTETETDLEEAREMVRTLEAALRSEQRFSMFPGLRAARNRALTVQNRLLSAERELLEIERRLVAPAMSPEELTLLEAEQIRGRRVEADIAELPVTDEDIEGTRARLKEAYAKVSHRSFQLLSRVRAMRAQLVAVRLWMRDQGVERTPEEIALTAQRMTRAGAEIAALEQALEGIDEEVERAALLSRGDGGWARAERLRQSLYAAIDEQAALLLPARARLSGDRRGLTARLDQQRTALRELERELMALQTRLERSVDARVDEVRKQVIDVLSALESERAEHQRLAGQADLLLGPVAEQTVQSVGNEFRELVLEADVGILDVAWARKQQHTEKVTELVRELRRRSGELEEEFRDVLEDQ